MAESDTILQLGIEAAREGNREEARNLFGLLTRQEPDNVQAWLWLAGVAESPEERYAALERVVELDPNNEMALKGLQAMRAERGAQPATRSPAPEAVLPMTDEERYAAELDSAFDDYDALPKTVAPPRPVPEEADADTVSFARERPTEAGRATARDRVTARRLGRTGRLPDDDDEGLASPDYRPSRLLWVLLALIGVLVVGFLLYQIFRDRGQQVAGSPTTTTRPGGVITSTLDLTPTPFGGEVLTATTALTDTGPLTPTGPLTDTGPLTPTAQPPANPPGGPPPDLAAANPAPVEIGAQLQASGWTYTYPDPSFAAVLGPQVGGFTTQGQYIVVLVWVANNTGTDQPLPANFFVLKDAQGRIYQPLPQVSSAYVIRGVNADLSMEDAVPANGVLTSVPVIFDVQHGATNLTLFARDKTDQGWQVLGNVP